VEEFFVTAQWDTLFAYLKTGRPPLWQLLAAVNGALLLFWIYSKIGKDRPLRPATMHTMRLLFAVMNTAMIFREDTMRLLRPVINYFS
jgi:hypothetical protein